MNEVLRAKAPLLHAATRAWQRLPVVSGRSEDQHGPAGAVVVVPPGGRTLAVDAAPGDLVLIPSHGWWHVALVVAPDPEHTAHVQVAYVPPDRQAAQFTGGPYPAEPVVLFVQRNNCYRMAPPQE